MQLRVNRVGLVLDVNYRHLWLHFLDASSHSNGTHCIGHTYLRLLIVNYNISNVHLCFCDPTRMCALTYPTRRHVANSLGSMWPLQTLRSIKTTRSYLFADVSQLKQNKQCSIVSLSKRRHPKIGKTSFGGILHHSARERKQKTLKILNFCQIC